MEHPNLKWMITGGTTILGNLHIYTYILYHLLGYHIQHSFLLKLWIPIKLSAVNGMSLRSFLESPNQMIRFKIMAMDREREIE